MGAMTKMSPTLSPWPLIASGAAATAVIAFAMILAERPNPGFALTVAALLMVYVAGLGLGRLLFGRG
jgi:hypothetical protein